MKPPIPQGNGNEEPWQRPSRRRRFSTTSPANRIWPIRRCCFFATQRSQRTAHIVNANSQYNHPPLTKKRCYASERFTQPSTQASIRADLNLIDAYDAKIDEVGRIVLYSAGEGPGVRGNVSPDKAACFRGFGRKPLTPGRG